MKNTIVLIFEHILNISTWNVWNRRGKQEMASLTYPIKLYRFVLFERVKFMMISGNKNTVHINGGSKVVQQPLNFIRARLVVKKSNYGARIKQIALQLVFSMTIIACGIKYSCSSRRHSSILYSWSLSCFLRSKYASSESPNRFEIPRRHAPASRIAFALFWSSGTAAGTGVRTVTSTVPCGKPTGTSKEIRLVFGISTVCSRIIG